MTTTQSIYLSICLLVSFLSFLGGASTFYLFISLQNPHFPFSLSFISLSLLSLLFLSLFSHSSFSLSLIDSFFASHTLSRS